MSTILRTQAALGGTDGATLTTANTGTSTDSAFDTIFIQGSGTLTYSASLKLRNSFAIVADTHSTTAAVYGVWANLGNVHRIGFRTYLKKAVAPGVAQKLAYFYKNGGVNLAASLILGTDSKLVLAEANGTTTHTLSTAVPTGASAAWFRLEVYFDSDTGEWHLETYIGANIEGSTPDFHVDWDGVTPGVFGPVDSVKIFNAGSNNSGQTLFSNPVLADWKADKYVAGETAASGTGGGSGTPSSETWQLGVFLSGTDFTYLTGATVDPSTINLDDIGAQPVDPYLLTVGEATHSRTLLASSGANPQTQVLRLAYFTARKTETITSLRWYSGGTAMTATVTRARWGIYSVAADGTLTLVASTPNDITLWGTVNTKYTKALSASWNKVAGTRYAIGPLLATSGTVGTLTGLNLVSASTGELFEDPPMAAQVTGQADLPSTISPGSLAASNIFPYVAMLPA